jgi:hypothetical protein
MGRWFPQDTSYVIGRYMYETDSLPMAWAKHCNNLNEIWVPSRWQRDTFSTAGVKRNLIQVSPNPFSHLTFGLSLFSVSHLLIFLCRCYQRLLTQISFIQMETDTACLFPGRFSTNMRAEIPTDRLLFVQSSKWKIAKATASSSRLS